MLGTDIAQNTVWQGDTAELYATFFDDSEAALDPLDIETVEFKIRTPDGVDTTAVGTILDDGSCYYRFTGTTQVGLHKWTAQITMTTGEVRTFLDEFFVEDPLVDPPITQASQIADEVWMRLEECFDSENGGPWLRDRTLAYFEPRKIERFIPEGLLRVNMWPPATTLDLTYFTTELPSTDPALVGELQPDPDRIVIVQSTLLAVIRHLMRSYVEQPAPQGANVVWQDRRDYLQRWQSIYQIEEAAFKEMVAFWKRGFYNFGRGALLTHSKAGRLAPTGWRARNASRGYT